MDKFNVLAKKYIKILTHKMTEETDSIDITTRQMVIQNGLEYLEGMGADVICKLCISKGGSCCGGCDKLKDGDGCQSRNTSCTSWLCGFLHYLLYEAGLYQEWSSFWNQVPGQNFRKDGRTALKGFCLRRETFKY